jgi:hypothetical protein
LGLEFEWRSLTADEMDKFKEMSGMEKGTLKRLRDLGEATKAQCDAVMLYFLSTDELSVDIDSFMAVLEVAQKKQPEPQKSIDAEIMRKKQESQPIVYRSHE